MRHHEVTPVILINLNVPPADRYKVENIPGLRHHGTQGPGVDVGTCCHRP
jgi:hypothetical protein